MSGIEITTGGTVPMYPCDRGIVGNVTARGYHHFEANQHGAVCVYCGKRADQ